MAIKIINNVRGFSLLEILIATVLGLWLLDIVLQNYLLAKNVYREADSLTTLSENIRFADFILWQTITQAGFAGYKRLSELDLFNHLPSRLSEVKAIHGYSSNNIPRRLLGKVVPGTDIIIISKATAEWQPIVSDITKGTTSFKVRRKLSSKSNSWIIISDCVNADLFEIDNRHHKTLRFKTPLQHAYKKNNTMVRYFEVMAFFISDTGVKDQKNLPILGLYFSINDGDKSEIASGVSDMKIRYGIDIDGSGKIAKYLSADEVSDISWWDKVSSIVITLKLYSGSLSRQKNLYIKLRGRG